jgi:hypothetical protein
MGLGTSTKVVAQIHWRQPVPFDEVIIDVDLSGLQLLIGFAGEEEFTFKRVANDFGLEANFTQQPKPICT